MPVHRGNIVKPREAAAAPTVEFPSAESGLWTLVMTGLDSHLQSEDKQVNTSYVLRKVPVIPSSYNLKLGKFCG